MSPDATHTVMPRVAAAWNASSMAVMRLRGPGRFRAAPADGDDGRIVRRVVDRRGDGVEKTGVGVRARNRRRCRACGAIEPDHLDIEHDLAVGSLGIAGRAVGRVIDRHRGDRRRGHIEPAEIGAEIRGAIAAAELDERDALAGAGAARITVERGHLRAACTTPPSRGAPVNVADRRPGAKMGPRLRAVVEPENRLDHAVPFGGQVDAARASSIRAAGVATSDAAGHRRPHRTVPRYPTRSPSGAPHAPAAP